MPDFMGDLAEIIVKDEVIMDDKSTASQTESEVKKEEVAPPQAAQKTEETKSDEPDAKKELPFHKHPRWIRQQQENAELKASIEALKAERAQAPVQAEQQVHVPEHLKTLFGEDTEAYKQWQTMLDKTAEERARAVFEKMQAEKESQSKAEQTRNAQAVAHAEDKFIELSDELGIDFTSKSSTERNQVLDIVAKYNIYDEKGFPDITRANELRVALYPPKTDVVDEKKKIASRSASRSTGTQKQSDVMTSSKLRKMSMQQFLN